MDVRIEATRQHISLLEIPSDFDDEVNGSAMLIMLSTNDEQEPRFQISDGPGTQLIFR